jgi:hypothetical protein
MADKEIDGMKQKTFQIKGVGKLGEFSVRILAPNRDEAIERYVNWYKPERRQVARKQIHYCYEVES